MFYSRIVEKQLQQLLWQGKALVVVGARQVGKTTMLRKFCEQFDRVLWLNADEGSVRNRLTDPSIEDLRHMIGTHTVLVIDEVQRIANAGILLKLLVDNFKDVQFLVSGSSALEISEKLFEPLTGRQFLFHLHPFSMSELYAGHSGFELEKELPFHLVHGNYPEVALKRNLADRILRDLTDQYLYKDVLVWKDLRKPELLDKLLKLLAYQIGSEVSINELANNLEVKSATVESYLNLLEKTFVVKRLKAYATNPRKEVTKMSKVFFWDNGVRNAIIDDLSPLASRTDHGQLFENFVISERMKMNLWTGSGKKSFFWRNYNQREVDYVEIHQGKISAFEMKWNSNKKHRVSKAFTNLYPDAEVNIITPRNLGQVIMERE